MSGEAAASTARVLVTLCTYNESENLAGLIPVIQQFAPQAEVLVIDDNSPDGTGRLADEMSARDARLRVLHRPRKLGLGTAILEGFRYALEHGFDFVVNLDADFSHHPRHIPELLHVMKGADVAIGSRYVPGGGVVGWGFRRKFMSQGINWYARLWLGLRTRDNSGGYRCYRGAKLRELDLGKFLSRGYAFQEEVLYRCRRIGCRFAESPIVFEDRRYGRSKINNREVVAALIVIARLGIESLFGISVRPAAEHAKTP